MKVQEIINKMPPEVTGVMMALSNEIPLPYKEKLLNIYAVAVLAAYGAGRDAQPGSGWTYASDSPPMDNENIIMDYNGRYRLGYCIDGVYYSYQEDVTVRAPTRWTYIVA